MATRRAQQKAATRQRLLAAARRHFEAHGFEKANLRAIAREAGVSAATVIVHFSDKRELLHATLFEELEATLEQVLADLPDAALAQQLHALAQGVLGYYQRRPRLSRTLLKESLFAEPPWAGRFAGQVGRVHARIAALVEAAVERGELAPGHDPALFGVAWFSFFYFALIGWVQGQLPDPVALVDRLTAQHLRGLEQAPD